MGWWMILEREVSILALILLKFLQQLSSPLDRTQAYKWFWPHSTSPPSSFRSPVANPGLRLNKMIYGPSTASGDLPLRAFCTCRTFGLEFQCSTFSYRNLLSLQQSAQVSSHLEIYPCLSQPDQFTFWNRVSPLRYQQFVSHGIKICLFASLLTLTQFF